MGNKAVRRSSLPFNPSDYEQIRPKQISEDSTEPPTYRLLRHIRTGMEMEQYRLQFNDEAELNDYYETFEWRLNQQHVVSTCYFLESHRKQFCSTHYGALLYTQRIPIKLSEIKDIPYPDNLYILLSALEGFHLIYHKTGYFQAQQHMICINKQGKVKVWINDNISKKYPEALYTQTDGCEEDMVRKIVYLVDENTDGASQPEPIPSYLKRHVSHPNFNECKMLLKQYAKENSVTIPKSFECILEVLNSDYHSQMTDSRLYEFDGKKPQKQFSVRSHRLRKQQKHSDDSMSQHSFQKRSQISQNHKVIYQHPQLLQPPLRQTRTNLIQGPLPVISQGRPLIQHMHYSKVGGMPPIPPITTPPTALLLPQNQHIPSHLRPQFHSAHQPHEVIISQAPSRQNILEEETKSMRSRYSTKDRRLNIYSEEEESQYGQSSYAAPPVKQIALIQHHFVPQMQHISTPMSHPHPISMTPSFPYSISPNNIIARPEYLPQQQVILHNNFDSSQRSNRSSRKQYSLSRKAKDNADESNRSISRHRRKKHFHDSDQSLTDEEYEDDRRRNRRRQQNHHYRRQQPIIDENQDDEDSESERVKKSRRKEKKRLKEEEQYRRFKEDQLRRKEEELRKEEQRVRLQHEEVSRKMKLQKQQQEYFKQKQEEENAKQRQQQEASRKRQEQLNRRQQQQYNRQSLEYRNRNHTQSYEEETRRREQQYLRQKHLEQLEYFRTKQLENSSKYQSEAPVMMGGRNHKSTQFLHMTNTVNNPLKTSTKNIVKRQESYRRQLQQVMSYGEDTAILVYHSAEKEHELDPEIARDLLALRV